MKGISNMRAFIIIFISLFIAFGAFGQQNNIDPIAEARRLLKLQKIELVQAKDTIFLQKSEIASHKGNIIFLKSEIDTLTQWGLDQQSDAQKYFGEMVKEKSAKEAVIKKYHFIKNILSIAIAAVAGFIGFYISGFIASLVPPPYNLAAGIVAPFLVPVIFAGIGYGLTFLIL